MKKKDFIVIFIVFLFIVITFSINYFMNIKSGENIEIYVNNELYKTYSINDNEEIKIKVKEGYNIVKIHDRGVEMIKASCPDKVCINSGFITKPSESIVCLPNKVHIKIKTYDENENKEDIISN